MSMAPTLLSVQSLSKSYGGVHAVRSVSFELRAGEILALIGPNGAGKSTCFDMLNGQNTPDSGRIHLLFRGGPHLPVLEAAKKPASTCARPRVPCSAEG